MHVWHVREDKRKINQSLGRNKTLIVIVTPPFPPPSNTLPATKKKQRAAYVASCWLRVAKRAASKRALTVALAVALAFPSLNAASLYSSGSGQGFAAGGASSSRAHPAVELVLPSSGNAAAAERATPASVAGDGGVGVGGQQRGVNSGTASGGASGAGGRTAASRAAFVRPWGEEAGGGVRSSKGAGAVAAAVRAPSRVAGGKGGKSGPVTDTTKDALRSVAAKAGVEGRGIAEDFGGHIKVCCCCCCLGV